MVSSSTNHTLAGTFVPSLERITSIAAEPVNGPMDPPVKPAVYSVSFTGARRGRLEVAAGQSFAFRVAGFPPHAATTPPEVIEEADDRLMDLVDLIGRSIVPGLVDRPRDELDFSPPTLRSMAIEWDWPAMVNDPRTQLFNADGQLLAVRLVELA